MGAILDASALLAAERGRVSLDLVLGAGERVAIAAVTATELLEAAMGTADPGSQTRRAAFVERLLERVEVLPFDATTARVYARLEAETGRTLPARELQLAATALSRGWRLVTTNGKRLGAIPGLEVIKV